MREMRASFPLRVRDWVGCVEDCAACAAMVVLWSLRAGVLLRCSVGGRMLPGCRDEGGVEGRLGGSGDRC